MKSIFVTTFFSILISISSIQAQTLPIHSFTDSYSSSLLDFPICSVNTPMIGYEPTGSGPYPVMIYTVATFGVYNAGEVDTVLQNMASRGVIAVSPKYYNVMNKNCVSLAAKATCLYGAQSTSAISKACARPGADCNNSGIVVSGFSQGGQLAITAANYDSRVYGVYAMGAGVTSTWAPLNMCLADGQRALSSNQLLLVNGEHDQYSDQATSELISGITCSPNSYDCRRSNGSGWYRVKDSEVEKGIADHVYFSLGFLTGRFDINWLPPSTTPWSISEGMRWLRQWVGP